MAKGGKRPGAGRKPGSLDKFKEETAAAVAASGITPLEYMLSILRDTSQDQEHRIDAAKSAAPYCHPRLNSVTMDARVQQVLSQAEIDARLAALGIKL